MPVGRPKKIDTVDDKHRKEIIRMTQCKPYNTTGKHREAWTELKHRLLIFCEKEDRTYHNAILHLLTSALDNHNIPFSDNTTQEDLLS